MLIYFSVANYKSFRDKADFNMIASPLYDSKETEDHVFRGYIPHLLRTSAIYGSNGAGKSNLLEALGTLKRIICGNYYKNAASETLYYKLEDSYKDKPTEFEAEYIAEGKRFVYHLAILSDKIIQEWLSEVDENGNPSIIFNREFKENGEVIKMPVYEQNEKETLRLEIYAEELAKKKLRTYLEYGATHGVKELSTAYEWFLKQLEVVSPGAQLVDRLSFFSNPQMLSLAVEMIRALDLSINDLKVVSVPFDEMFSNAFPQNNIEEIKNRVVNDKRTVIVKRDGMEFQVYKDEDDNIMAGRLITIHKNGVEFELNEESTGTRMVLDLIPSFVASIVGNKIFVFDEIEVNKHPELTKELIMIYLLAGNIHKGQLIFTTHECNLLDLDILRPDEIWFVEKDDNEASHIYSLSDFKPHYGKDIKKGYLDGKFTRIPFFTDPKQLKWYGNTESADNADSSDTASESGPTHLMNLRFMGSNSKQRVPTAPKVCRYSIRFVFSRLSCSAGNPSSPCIALQ